MNTNKEDMRELAAQLYAVVVSTMSGNELKIAVQNLIKITKDTHVCTLFCILKLTSNSLSNPNTHRKESVISGIWLKCTLYSECIYLQSKHTPADKSQPVATVWTTWVVFKIDAARGRQTSSEYLPVCPNFHIA